MNRYIFQQQNSVSKKWTTIAEGNLDEMEKQYEERVNDPENVRFGHKYRVMEMSKIHAN